MAQRSAPAETPTPTAVASYVATLTTDLAAMSRKSGLNTLGYLLEMARLEAEGIAGSAETNGRR
jgi:hypothetical protein